MTALDVRSTDNDKRWGDDFGFPKGESSMQFWVYVNIRFDLRGRLFASGI